MVIREYQPADCKEIIRLFYDTVHSVNAKDHTEEQLNAWAMGKADLEIWNRLLLGHYSLVALENSMIIGFGDIDKSGYLDRLYVHKDYQGKGIASAIMMVCEPPAHGILCDIYSATSEPSSPAKL